MAPHKGKRLSERRYVVDERALADFHAGLELPAQSNGKVPSTLACEPDNAYFSEIAFDQHVGHLWMRQEWRMMAPLEVGAVYTVGGEIRDIYRRRDRTVVQYQCDFHDESGRLVLETQHHQSFLLDEPGRPEVDLRDPKSKPGARRFVRPDGEPFGGLECQISVEMCGRFFHGDANYHTDRAASEELGFQDVVVGGRMTLAYVAHLLEERFGESWWNGGRLDLKFTNPVWADDTVVARGIEVGPSADDPSRTESFLWLEKPDETVVLVATASVPSP